MPRAPKIDDPELLRLPPAIFVKTFQAKSKEGSIPHRPSYWIKRAIKKWNGEKPYKKAVSDRVKRSYWRKQIDLDKVVRCGQGPVWMWKNCTDKSPAELKRAKEFYRAYKPKGACMSPEDVEDFGCDGLILKSYRKTFRQKMKPDTRKETILKRLKSKERVVDERELLMRQIKFFQKKIVTAGLSFGKFIVVWSSYQVKIHEWQKMVEYGFDSKKEEKWSKDLDDFTHLLEKIIPSIPIPEGKTKANKLPLPWKEARKILVLLKGFWEDKKATEKKINDVLIEKGFSTRVNSTPKSKKVPLSLPAPVLPIPPKKPKNPLEPSFPIGSYGKLDLELTPFPKPLKGKDLFDQDKMKKFAKAIWKATKHAYIVWRIAFSSDHSYKTWNVAYSTWTDGIGKLTILGNRKDLDLSNVGGAELKQHRRYLDYYNFILKTLPQNMILDLVKGDNFRRAIFHIVQSRGYATDNGLPLPTARRLKKEIVELLQRK